MQNFGPNCNYFSIQMDCGLNSRKGKGSLTKVPGRTGKIGSGRLDLDWTVQIGLDLDLISSIAFGLDGSDPSGRGAAAEHAGDSVPRRRGPMLAGVWRFLGSRARLGLEFGPWARERHA